MRIIEFAEKRLNDKNNEDFETRYWAAYLEGANAQLRETLESRKTIEDVMICHHCGSENCYEYNTDEIDFSDDNEHYYVDCKCNDCGKNFRLYIKFKYTITESWIK